MGTQPPPLKRRSPNFRPTSIVVKWLHGSRCHLVWRKASAWLLCVRCGPSSPLPPEKRAHPPPAFFGPCLLWPDDWMDEDATWYGSRPRSRPHCIRRGPSCQRKGHSSPHHLFVLCLLWPRSPISATAELLFWWWRWCLLRSYVVSPVVSCVLLQFSGGAHLAGLIFTHALTVTCVSLLWSDCELLSGVVCAFHST